MPGVSLMYCIICGFGLIFTYIVLPETEDRSLEDIELHFSDNSKNITDRKIAKSKSNHSRVKDDEKSNGVKIRKLDRGYDNEAFETEISRVWLLCEIYFIVRIQKEILFISLFCSVCPNVTAVVEIVWRVHVLIESL